MLAKNLKTKLANRQLCLGALMIYHCWPGYLEIIKRSGYDLVWLCCEHSAFTLQQVDEMCRVARLLDLPLILRAETANYHLIRRYMDAGPSGIIIPYVERAEQIDILRQASYLPPKGTRSPGGQSVSWITEHNRASWDEYEKDFFRMIQVESIAGIKALPDLLKRDDFIDAVMVGPYDLAVSLGQTVMDSDSPVVSEAIEKVMNICRKHNKPCGMVVGNIDQARFWMERGFCFIICGELVNILADSVKSFHDGVRSVGQTITAKPNKD
ncbi:MAG: hypothetical protein GWP14_09990 [Actinobacteria bacterium]|nr:hypothetical protein [Actinomycetota bacterium]